MIRIKFLKWRPVYSWDGKTWWHVPPYPRTKMFVLTNEDGVQDVLACDSDNPIPPAGRQITGYLGSIKRDRL